VTDKYQVACFKQDLNYCLDLTGNSRIWKEQNNCKNLGEGAFFVQHVYSLAENHL